MSFWDRLTKNLAIDAGSEMLRISDGEKIIFNQPSTISIDTDTHKVSGIGINTVETHNAFIPVNNVIQDFYAFENLLRGATTQSIVNRNWFQTNFKMHFSIPTTVTEVEKRAYRDAAEHAGAGYVHMLHQSSAAAIGLNILFRKKDFVIVDFSASKIEFTIFINSLIADGQIINIGTWKLRKVIKNFVFRKSKESLNDTETDAILINLAENKEHISFRGKQLLKGELLEVIEHYFFFIEDEILELFERASNHPQIQKVMANGLYFTGGGSKIGWLVEKIAEMAKLKFTVSSQPQLDNINGVSYVMNHPDKFKDYLMV